MCQQRLHLTAHLRFGLGQQRLSLGASALLCLVIQFHDLPLAFRSHAGLCFALRV